MTKHSAAPCPMCARPSNAPFTPFCSRRCSMRDLARWIGTGDPYVIPGDPVAPDPGDGLDSEPPPDDAGA